jgi:hypothetical protein
MASALYEAALRRVSAATAAVGVYGARLTAAQAAPLAREIDAHAAHPEAQELLLRHVEMFLGPELRSSDLRCLAEAALRALHTNGAADAGVVAAAFAALEELAQAPALESQLAEATIRVAVDAMRGAGDFATHAGRNLGVAAGACLTLYLTVRGDAHKARIALGAGALGALAAMMHRSPHVYEVQHGACNSLHALLNAGFLPKLEADADARRAADATLAALESFLDDATLANLAAKVLFSLMRDGVARKTPAFHARALDAVLRALRRHLADAAAADAACLMFSMVDTQAVPPAAAVAVVDAVMCAVHMHTAHAPTQEHGLSVVGVWARYCPHTAARAVAAGAFEAAVHAMRGHRAEPSVQVCACMLIVSICGSTSARDAFARDSTSGAITAVVDMLRTANKGCGDAAEWERRVAMCTLAYEHPVQGYAMGALKRLLQGYPPDMCLHAVHAGALSVLETPLVRETIAASSLAHAEMVLALKRAAEAHVQRGRACAKCAALRTSGAMCGFAGCAVCARPADGGRLLVCTRCRRVAYCGPEHQRLAWRASHKAECVPFASAAAAEQ